MIALLLILYHGFVTTLGFDSVVVNLDALFCTFVMEILIEVLIGLGFSIFRSY